jgi:chromate transporter
MVGAWLGSCQNCGTKEWTMEAPTTGEIASPSIVDLFAGFFIVGVYGFGGVLPWARRMIVEQRKWLTPVEFTDMLGLCSFLPGGNIMNVTIALGARFRGIPGAAACFLGLMTAPVAIVIALGVVYDRYANLPSVRQAFVALSAAAAAFALATAWKIASPLRGKPLAIGVAACTFVAIAVLRLPLVAAMPVLTIGSTLLLWRFQK